MVVMKNSLCLLLGCLTLLFTAEAGAQEAPKAITFGGYAEAYYSRNFNNPQNRVTANRWLDERNNSITLQTVAFDVAASKGPFSGTISLMFGPTADRWYGYGVKPKGDGDFLDSGNYSNETWKHIQKAYVGYKAPLGNGLLLQAGLFPTQVGFEGPAVKNNWNYSRSNLFYFLPYYHLGARAYYPVTDKVTVMGAVYNGWTQPVDLNDAKSASAQAVIIEGDWEFDLLYIGGKERALNDKGGRPWRHLFDGIVQYNGIPRLNLVAHATGGFEENRYGTQTFYGGAAYAYLKVFDWMFLAGRVDGLKEKVPAEATSFYFGEGYVLSSTATAEFRPIGDGFSLMLEYRHDESSRKNPLYYTRGFDPEGKQRLSPTQSTFTVGITGWF